ncbi:DNA methylase [Azorhizobium oxalatiphilum]|uniref:DNA methylase n=1 Tax=Azorhizobium oxalatiphilum TaxID=980631 RepID=A0A917BQ00_9HYPH|nr:metallophosphoesterase family protein [Azorhizobium oxalatiphilum]GGF52619.1 DNA methylase [Azorhizobium oxalatiphilum]
MRIAVISDVHGNAIALKAVLEHLKSAHADLIVNLGDLVSGPFDPALAADMQMDLDAATLAGNHERQVLAGSTGRVDAFARQRLSAAHLDWMARLPPTLSLADGEVFACHGSPAGGDLEYMLEDVSEGRVRLSEEDAIRPRIAGIGAAKVVLCGHSHTPRLLTLDGVLLVNPGSVGLPAYRDLEPPHVVETGAPHARYAVLERLASGWAVDMRAVPYDFEAAGRQAEQHDRPDLAHAVRTGTYRPGIGKTHPHR